MKNITLLFTFILLSSFKINAQWSQGKGNGYFKLSAWNLDYDQYYNNEGEIISSGNNRNQFNLNLYAEYGLLQKLDLIAHIPFYSLAMDENLDDSMSSVGDIDVGIHYNLFKNGRWSASTKLIFGLPTGNFLGGDSGTLQTGDGEFNQLISLNLGYSGTLKSTPVFTKTSIGFNNRNENFSDELRLGIETGISFFNNQFWLIAKLDRIETLQNGSFQNNFLTPGSIFGNNIEFTSLGLELSHYFYEDVGVNLQYTTALSGRNIAANAVLSAGLFLQIK